MTNRKNFFNSIDFWASESHGMSMECVTVLDENGWISIDITTKCKNMKTAVNRLFSVFTNEEIKYYELDGWKAAILESIESGYFMGGKYACLLNGWNEKDYWYSWGIEFIDENTVYFFVNVNYGIFKA